MVTKKVTLTIILITFIFLSSCSGVVRCNNFAKKAVHEVLVDSGKFTEAQFHQILKLVKPVGEVGKKSFTRENIWHGVTGAALEGCAGCKRTVNLLGFCINHFDKTVRT